MIPEGLKARSIDPEWGAPTGLAGLVHRQPGPLAQAGMGRAVGADDPFHASGIVADSLESFSVGLCGSDKAGTVLLRVPVDSRKAGTTMAVPAYA
jgi:hypothetical protein